MCKMFKMFKTTASTGLGSYAQQIRIASLPQRPLLCHL